MSCCRTAIRRCRSSGPFPLSQADHDNFSKIYFGFTEATGRRTQQITLSNFRASYPQGTWECSYGISPTDATFAAAGGTGSVTVAPKAACLWWAAAVNPDYTSWLHITSGSSGTGNGTVTQAGGRQYVVATHAYVSGSRVYVNADVTGGTPTSVTWTLDGSNNQRFSRSITVILG